VANNDPFIAVVDGESPVRTMLRRLLRLAESDACVVSDLKLPGISGLELLAKLHSHGWSQPLMLITAHDSPAVRAEAGSSGVAGYLAKPFLGSALVTAIKAAIESAGTKKNESTT
jgi:FixJ family two-component response regulator